ncbi:hypothetical protein D3C75_748220 [compost metagenome]
MAQARNINQILHQHGQLHRGVPDQPKILLLLGGGCALLIVEKTGGDVHDGIQWRPYLVGGHNEELILGLVGCRQLAGEAFRLLHGTGKAESQQNVHQDGENQRPHLAEKIGGHHAFLSQGISHKINEQAYNRRNKQKQFLAFIAAFLPPGVQLGQPCHHTQLYKRHIQHAVNLEVIIDVIRNHRNCASEKNQRNKQNGPDPFRHHAAV